jgi:hypothetical protein
MAFVKFPVAVLRHSTGTSYHRPLSEFLVDTLSAVLHFLTLVMPDVPRLLTLKFFLPHLARPFDSKVSEIPQKAMPVN